MSYYVLEIQTNADGTSGVIPYNFTDKADAEDKYLDLWKVALRSSVLIHTVVFITDRGVNVRPPVSFTHPQPEPEINEG